MAHLFKTVVDLNQKNREVIWDTLATVGDKNAHTFAIGLRSDNRSVDLANARVQLLVRRADKKDRIITGSVSDDNYAVATLDEYCYEITGRIRCTLLISVNGATLTGVRATLTVEDGLGDVIINPAGEIPNLQDLLAEIDGMRQATAAANTAAKNANDAAAMIEQIRADIESAVNEAKEAVEEAETAVSEATTAIKEAQKITTGWANAQTEAESVPSDSPAEVNMGLDDDGNRILIFKIPKGQNGLNPHIGANGHWFVGNVDTGIKAKGDTGDDGITPHIGTNGNWFVGSADTGVRAQGPQGAPGTGSGTVTGVVLNGQTYVPNNLGVIELPELGGSDVELSDSVPSALGQTASAGKGSKAAREDHVHKMPSASDTGALGKNEQAVDSAKLAGKEPSHYENKIKSITANGQVVQPDENGAVNLGTIGRSNLEIDDTTPSGNKTYSSEKIEGELSSLSQQIADIQYGNPEYDPPKVDESGTEYNNSSNTTSVYFSNRVIPAGKMIKSIRVQCAIAGETLNLVLINSDNTIVYVKQLHLDAAAQWAKFDVNYKAESALRFGIGGNAKIKFTSTQMGVDYAIATDGLYETQNPGSLNVGDTLTIRRGTSSLFCFAAQVEYSDYIGSVEIRETLLASRNLVTKTDRGRIVVDINGKGDFTTITEAVNNSSAELNRIYILPGVYEEEVLAKGLSYPLYFEGANRETTILKSPAAKYSSPPLDMTKGGIKNMTIIAYDDGVNAPDENSESNKDRWGAYAVHCDGSNAAANSEFVIDNCTLISHWNAALGVGTFENQLVVIRNSELVSYNSYFTEQSENNGAFIFHNNSGEDYSGQRLVVENTTMYALNGDKAMFIQLYRDNAGTSMRFNNVCVYNPTGGRGDNAVMRTHKGSAITAWSSVPGLEINGLSFGNSAPILDAQVN